MHFHFCLQRARYDHPIRQKVPWENQWKKNFEKWGFEITEFRSSNGKTTGNRFDFEIAGLLRLNLVRNIEGPLCSEIPCLVALRVARCLGTWSCFCAYRRTVTVPVSVRFSLTQTLQGEQYQFIEMTIYPPLLVPESQKSKISKRRIEPRSLKEPRCVKKSCWLSEVTATQ